MIPIVSNFAHKRKLCWYLYIVLSQISIQRDRTVR